MYLPQDLLDEFGVTVPEVHGACRRAGAIKANERAMLTGLSVQAWEYYEAAQALLPLIDADARGALWVLVEIYSGLLKKIDRAAEGMCSQSGSAYPRGERWWHW